MTVYLRGGTRSKFEIKVKYLGITLYPRKKKPKKDKKKRRKKARKEDKKKDDILDEALEESAEEVPVFEDADIVTEEESEDISPVESIAEDKPAETLSEGSAEDTSTEEETALRECLEETGLKVNIKKGFREVVNYYIPEIDVNKDVVLFVGEIDNLDYHRQEKEIDDIKVCQYQETYNLLEFDNWKNALKKANDFLKTII